MERFKSVTTIFLLATGWFTIVTENPAFADNPMRIIIEESVVSVRAGDSVLLNYRYENVPFKPYVQQFFSPDGVNVVRDAPADHLHHHGLMFAVAVGDINFWEEHNSPGRQAHRRLTNVRIARCDDIPLASFTEHIDWLNPRDQELLLKERRTIEVCQMKNLDVSLLTWQGRFELPPGRKSATLSGNRYFGLGMRFLESMDTGGQFRNADGKTGVDGTNNTRAAWCAYTAGANGKPVTIAMFDHPDNERYPATWFTMDDRFAYLSLTMNLKEQPLKIASDKPLVVQYGVALWDGRVQAEQIEQLYRQWIAQPQETPHISKPKQIKPKSKNIRN